MIALDTSVVVPALVAWHEAHEVAREAASGAAVPAPARVEAYAVLTRLPSPHRLDAAVAAELLDRRFSRAHVLLPSASLHRSFVGRLAAAGIVGGAAYDALVALTAAEHDAELLTRDARARRTYERLGVAHRFVG